MSDNPNKPKYDTRKTWKKDGKDYADFGEGPEQVIVREVQAERTIERFKDYIAKWKEFIETGKKNYREDKEYREDIDAMCKYFNKKEADGQIARIGLGTKPAHHSTYKVGDLVRLKNGEIGVIMHYKSYHGPTADTDDESSKSTHK